MRLVLDTNVYLAAFLNKGLASSVFRLGQRRKVALFISSAMVVELKGKLKNKFKLDQKTINKFVSLVLQSSKLIKPKQRLRLIKSDPEDNKILECAVAAKADLIISMDKHLTKLKAYKQIGIVHPKALTWIIPNL